ncbi:MAG: hypothetical protein OXF41_10670 [bacterium]|nr:hypothetical protein [bacterium]
MVLLASAVALIRAGDTGGPVEVTPETPTVTATAISGGSPPPASVSTPILVTTAVSATTTTLVSSLQFLIRARLQAGTYYVKARGFASMIRTNTRLYSVHVETVTEPGSTLGTARSLSFSRAEGGGSTRRTTPTTSASTSWRTSGCLRAR